MPALMEPVAATLGASLVQLRLDYANSIMCGMSASNVLKLQSAQNCSFRDMRFSTLCEFGLNLPSYAPFGGKNEQVATFCSSIPL